MTHQELEDKLAELVVIVQAQQSQITSVHQQVSALVAIEDERGAKRKREASARRMASPSPYDACSGGFRNRR